jgi:hypothetical protein
VGVTAVPNGDGRLLVTITANTNGGTPTNQLAQIGFTGGTNARFDMGLELNKLPPLMVTLPAGTQQATFYLERLVAGQASSLTLSVVDGCGSWPTFVGGGPGAF